MNKRLSFIVVGILVVSFALGAVKNVIAKSAVEGIVKKVTGLNLTMKSLNIGIIKTLVEIRTLKIYNPRGFKDRVMVDAPEIFVDYDLQALFKGKVHIEEMRFHLKELIVVKNEEGEVNINYLKPAPSKKAEKNEKKKGSAQKMTLPDIRIDRLHLRIGKVIYKDYTGGGEPLVQEYDIRLDETHHDISNPSALVGLIVAKAIMNTSISQLADLDMKGLMSNFDFAGTNMKDLGLSKFQDLSQKLVGVREKAGEVFQGIADYFKGTQAQ